tara:strand:+ start:1978 stop:2190 length:213 start_codon:yes stop_codon:yes gene_type:complete
MFYGLLAVGDVSDGQAAQERIHHETSQYHRCERFDSDHIDESNIFVCHRDDRYHELQLLQHGSREEHRGH